ncbi:hypothetical protein [Halovivax gelatinilyticus]|uniref:hypothetical protein n=1 Tax=Halovivax gelatinilyticus TaxID=2961597 RepID=UPI0020CA47E8|nr:hypothetical protein [Halovivax gelatinilyticus]
MSVNLHQLIEGADGAFEADGARVDAAVSAAVKPGEPITLALSTTGPNARSRSITVSLTRSEARLLGGRLVESTR